MKQFIKFVFASCLGTVLALGGGFGLLLLIGIASAPQESLPKTAVLKLNFNQPIPELTDNVPETSLFGTTGSAVGVVDIARLLKKAADDSSIKGILLQTQQPSLTPTTAAYIIDQLKEFKTESGKFIHAYGDYFSQTGYMIATVADTVLLNPNGVVDLKGYGYAIPHFKRFSDKTGIDFDVYYAGQFKSAIEPYYREDMSEQNRQQTTEYLQAYQELLESTISKNRDLSSAAIKSIIVDNLADNGYKALEMGLIDALTYYEDYEDYLKEKLGRSKVPFITLVDYFKAHPKKVSLEKNRVAVIYAEGTVAGGGDDKGTISMEVYEKYFERIEKSDKTKAVVLRVNSGGGSAFTSDVFLDRVKDLQEQGKYVVASFGDYAASGGYYIAASADKIYSEPTTLTGSIGVFSMIPNLNEFFEEKLGITWDTVTTGDYAFLYSNMIDRGPEDDAKLKSETERIYDQFKRIVAEGRNMSMDEVDEIAQGRVWTGVQGVEVGLVDEIGDIDDAIAHAAAQVGYEDYKVVKYPTIKKTFFEELIASYAEEANAKIQGPKRIESEALTKFQNLVLEIDEACKEPQAKLPFQILID